MLSTTLPAIRHHHPYLYKTVYFVLAWVLAGVVLSIVARDPGIERAQGDVKIIPAMVYQRNERPVVTRVLIPWTIRGISFMVPAEKSAQIDELARTQPFVAHNFQKYGWLPDYATEYAVALFVLYACLIGFFYSFRYFARGIFEGPREFIDLCGLIALAAIPPMTRDLHTLYDFGTLFFMTLCFGLMVRRHWAAYILVFALACLNRETAILLPFIFIMNFHDMMRPGRLLGGFLVQIAIWAAIRGWIGWLYSANPGGLAVLTWDQNLKNLFLAQSYSLAQLMAVLALIFLIFHKWAFKPVFLKRALVWFVPTLVIYFFVGILNEWRIYFEWYPIFLCLALDSIKPFVRL
ncbi:hypothetical protein LLG95_17525 [bacterium]|nr:hypothetical protein [bacterium]